MKKIIALALALIMILGLATTASAEGEVTEPTATTYSITINNSKSGHTYEAYQIFVGDVYVTGEGENVEKILSNIAWGSSVTAEGKTALVDAETAAKNIADADAFAKQIAPYLTNPVKTAGTETGTTCVLDGLAPGYYLVKDAEGSLNGTNDSYTKYIVEVVENSEVTPKSSVPSVQKKVDDINDSNTTEDEVEWKDSADHDIGDHVPFQLKATLADNVEDYLKYKVVFHDTLSKGMNYGEGDSFKVYLGEGENRKDVTTYFTMNLGTYSETTGTKITFTCENVKAFGATDSSVIVVEYTATLNENANIGAPGNPNEVYLEYSNNPNWGWDVWTDADKDNEWDEGETPNNPGNDDDDNDGIPNDKDDDDDNDGTPDNEDDDDDNDGIKDDDEDGEEDTGKTPVDKVIVFTFKTDVNKVHQTGVDAEGKPVYAALSGAEFKLEKFEASKDGTTTFNGVKGEWATKALVKNDAGTTFSFKGMDDGEYRITETVAPAGYNKIDAIYFTVTAEHDLLADDPKLTKLEATQTEADLEAGEIATFDVVLENGAISTDVVNEAGVELPETGGMGTTLFYIIGGLLVAGAAILLITKKRMSANY